MIWELVIAAGICGTLVAVAADQLRRDGVLQGQLAELSGLRPQALGLVGQRDGRRVRVHRGEAIVVQVSYAAELDVQLRKGRFVVLHSSSGVSAQGLKGVKGVGSSTTLRALASDSALGAEARALKDFAVSDGWVRARVQTPHEVPECIRRLLRLAAAVDEAVAFKLPDLIAFGPNHLVSPPGSPRITVACSRVGDELWTVVSAAFTPPLSQKGLWSGTGGVSLRDPILDGRVAATREAADRLGDIDDELRSRLMEILHAYPRSEVTTDEVRVCIPGRGSEELVTALAAARTLAARLSTT